jgi:hypothetical protein
MRTTVTLEPEADAIVRRLMRERGLTFKDALNEAIRAGARPSRSSRKGFRTPTFQMGRPAVPIDKALRLAADLEDEEILRKLAARK